MKTAAEPGSTPRARRVFPILVFVVACFQYVNTLPYDYAWDDKLVITANQYTKKGVAGIPDMFTKRVSVPFKSEYRPVPQALYAIEYQVFRHSPMAGHAFNALWYALTCVMVFVFVRFVFPRLDESFALLVALLFAVHPLHVEVVANIKSRDEILALLFGLLSIVLLVKALEGLRWSMLVPGIASFLLACLSKTNAITLLPLVPFVAWYRCDEPGISRKLWMSVGAVAALSAGLVAVVRSLQSAVSADSALQLSSTVLNNIFLWSARPKTIVPTALVIVARYLRLFVVPHPLIHLYGYDQVPLSTWRDPITWLVVAGLAAVALGVWRTWTRKLTLTFGVIWAAVTYSVYSNLLFFAPDTMADRYLFMPSVGLAIVAVQLMLMAAGLDARAIVIRGARAKTVVAAFSIVLAAYFARTSTVNGDWRNDSTLINHRIKYMSNNAAAQVIYGQMLIRDSLQMSASAKRERRTSAMNAFREAIRIYPDFQAAWIATGRLFAEQGIFDKAELTFLKAQRMEPLNPDSYFWLGTLYLAEQDHDLAIPYLEKAVLLDPKMEDAYVMLGRAYLRSNNVDNLGAMATTARKWFPENTDVAALLATYYFRKKDYPRAFELARSVAAKDPTNVLALTILASPAAQDFPTR